MSVALSNITCLVNFLKNVITLFFSKQSFRIMTTDFSEICAVLLVKIVAHIFQLVSLTFLVFFVYYIKILFSFFSHLCDTQFLPLDYLKHTSVNFFLIFEEFGWSFAPIANFHKHLWILNILASSALGVCLYTYL